MIINATADVKSLRASNISDKINDHQSGIGHISTHSPVIYPFTSLNDTLHITI